MKSISVLKRKSTVSIVASAVNGVIIIVACSLLGISLGHGQLPTGWTSTDIGSPTAGSTTYSGGVYTVVGSGTGISTTSDQMRLTYYTLPAGGNFRLTARVASFNGVAGSQVGLTVRQATATTGSIGAVAYRPAAGTGTSPNIFEMFNRNVQTGAYYPTRTYYEKSAMAAPCYLQLVLYGNMFAI